MSTKMYCLFSLSKSFSICASSFSQLSFLMSYFSYVLSLHAQSCLSSDVSYCLIISINVFPFLSKSSSELIDLFFGHLISKCHSASLLRLASGEFFVLMHLLQVLVLLVYSLLCLLKIFRHSSVRVLLRPVHLRLQLSRSCSLSNATHRNVFDDIRSDVVLVALQTHDRLLVELWDLSSSLSSSVLEFVNWLLAASLLSGSSLLPIFLEFFFRKS